MMESFISSDIKRMIRDEIKRQTNIILIGMSGKKSTVFVEDTDNMATIYPTINNIPVSMPYGLCSMAPEGTVSVIGRQGSDEQGRLILNYKDANRPIPADRGEPVLYNQYGQSIYLKNGEVRIGNMESSNPAVLGNELKSMLQDLITLISNHTHVTSGPGSPTSPPIESAQFIDIRVNNVDNDNILSDYIFLDKSMALKKSIKKYLGGPP